MQGEVSSVGEVADAPSPQDLEGPDLPSTPPGCPSAPPPATAELRAGLVGYWDMNQEKGDQTAHDRSGRSLHGALEGIDGQTAWVPGCRGSALSMTDRDRTVGVAVQLPSTLEALTAYTVAARIYRSELRPTRYGGIVSRQVPGGNGEVFNLAMVHDQLRAYRPPSPAGVPGTVVDPEVPFPLGIWIHVAASSDGQELRLYRDGVLIDSDANVPLPPATTPLYIGTNKNFDTHQEPFHGLIDDVVFYDRALSPAAIALLAAGATPID